MADRERATGSAGASAKKSSDLLDIVRDAHFVRISADDFVVVHRDRDVQITLIAEGPEPKRQGMPTRRRGTMLGMQEIQLVQSFTELARVTLAPAKAFSLAMNIIESAVASGNVKIDPFRTQFLAMLEEHTSADQTASAASSE